MFQELIYQKNIKMGLYTIMNKEFFSSSEKDTEEIASMLAKNLAKGSTIALNGDLGAGKTVFTRGFARGLGITEPVSSPTFAIVQEYPLEPNGWLYHLDLYRIEDYRAALAFGIEEFIESNDAYTLIEWPERIAELLPDKTISVTIEHIDENSRKLTVSNLSDDSTFDR